MRFRLGKFKLTNKITVRLPLVLNKISRDCLLLLSVRGHLLLQPHGSTSGMEFNLCRLLISNSIRRDPGWIYHWIIAYYSSPFHQKSLFFFPQHWLYAHVLVLEPGQKSMESNHATGAPSSKNLESTHHWNFSTNKIWSKFKNTSQHLLLNITLRIRTFCIKSNLLNVHTLAEEDSLNSNWKEKKIFNQLKVRFPFFSIEI